MRDGTEQNSWVQAANLSPLFLNYVHFFGCILEEIQLFSLSLVEVGSFLHDLDGWLAFLGTHVSGCSAQHHGFQFVLDFSENNILILIKKCTTSQDF